MNGGCEISVVDIRDCAELSEFDARFFQKIKDWLVECTIPHTKSSVRDHSNLATFDNDNETSSIGKLTKERIGRNKMTIKATWMVTIAVKYTLAIAE